jgi:GMP synthase (glutamine-hydrolysing)
MPVRVLTIVHQPDAGPGVFADVAAERGAELVEWRPADGDPAPEGSDAALVLGGAMDVDQEAEHPWLLGEKELLRDLHSREVPVLGVCLGAQLAAEAANAAVGRAPRPEIGWVPVEVTGAGRGDPLIAPLAPRFDAFEWHSYAFSLPRGATELARSPAGVQAARLGPASWAIQFHAEVSEAIVRGWIAGYQKDADAVRIGLDPDALGDETARRIDGWNAAGRALFGRWLEAAERANGGPRPTPASRTPPTTRRRP